MSKTEVMRRGEETRLAVFGPEYALKVAKAKDEFGRPMRELGIRYNWASVWSRPGIDFKLRGLVNISILTALKLPNQLGDHVRGTLRNGGTPSEIRETLLQSAVYCGVATGAAAFGVAGPIVAEATGDADFAYDAGSEPEEGLLEYGQQVREEVFGSEHVANTAKSALTDEHSTHFREHQFAYIFGAVWGRGVLDYKTRCLLNVATMIALSRPGELELYMKAAIRHGATSVEVHEVLFQASVYAGVPAAVDGYKAAARLFGTAA